MLVLKEHYTIRDVLYEAAQIYGDNALICAPRNQTRDYYPDGISFSFTNTAEIVKGLAEKYAQAGYGTPHKIGLFLASRPEHMMHKLAMNSVGVCCVPINPDYRTNELVYLINHSKVELIVTLANQKHRID